MDTSPQIAPPDIVWINIKQACEFFGVSRRSIYHWIEAGKLTIARTPGRSIRIAVNRSDWSAEKAS